MQMIWWQITILTDWILLILRPIAFQSLTLFLSNLGVLTILSPAYLHWAMWESTTIFNYFITLSYHLSIIYFLTFFITLFFFCMWSNNFVMFTLLFSAAALLSIEASISICLLHVSSKRPKPCHRWVRSSPYFFMLINEILYDYIGCHFCSYVVLNFHTKFHVANFCTKTVFVLFYSL